MNFLDIKVKKLNEKAVIPTYGSEFAAGADAYACVDEDVVIKKGEAIAQAIFQKYLTVDDDNAEGKRTGGFGSTDKKDTSN